MAAKIIDGVPYSTNPKTIKFNKEIVELNVKKTDEEYQALLASIRDNGQLHPILIDSNGLCIDGRHRVMVCIELGIDVECVNIKATATMNEIIELANANEFAGRSLTATQKAFRVIDMVRTYGYTVTAARIKVGYNDAKGTTAVNFIYNNKEYADKYAKLLKENKPVHIYDKEGTKLYSGKSLRTIKEKLELIEKQTEEIDTSEDKVIEIDYNEYIDTAKGRDFYWKYVGNAMITMDAKLELIKCINTRFKKIED